MEMQEIIEEKETKKEENAGASELKSKTEEEAEPDHYSKLQCPAEDIYSETYYGDTLFKPKAGRVESAGQTDGAGQDKQAPYQNNPQDLFSMYIKFCRGYGEEKKDEASAKLSPKSGLSVELEGGKDKETKGNTRLYQAACLFLTIICLVLLLVVIILCVKLQTGSTVCPERAEATVAESSTLSMAPKCSYEQCQAHFPITQPKYRSCPQCPKGWLAFGQSCFFLSTFRMSWEQSQRNCSARGGSLAVISNEMHQRYLTKQGNLNYWIGLRQNGDTWMWVNNTVLGDSYWKEGSHEGGCAVLISESPFEKNWITARCNVHTYFICQMQL